MDRLADRARRLPQQPHMQPSRSAVCSSAAILAIPLWVRPLLSLTWGEEYERGRGIVRSRATHTDQDADGPGYIGPERRSQPATVEVAPVRLTHKYAEMIDGIDL